MCLNLILVLTQHWTPSQTLFKKRYNTLHFRQKRLQAYDMTMTQQSKRTIGIGNGYCWCVRYVWRWVRRTVNSHSRKTEGFPSPCSIPCNMRLKGAMNQVLDWILIGNSDYQTQRLSLKRMKHLGLAKSSRLTAQMS